MNLFVLCTAVVVGNMTEESDPVVVPSVVPSSSDGEKLADVSNDAIYPVMPVDGTTPVGHRTQLNRTGHGGSFNLCYSSIKFMLLKHTIFHQLCYSCLFCDLLFCHHWSLVWLI